MKSYLLSSMTTRVDFLDRLTGSVIKTHEFNNGAHDITTEGMKSILNLNWRKH